MQKSKFMRSFILAFILVIVLGTNALADESTLVEVPISEELQEVLANRKISKETFGVLPKAAVEVNNFAELKAALANPRMNIIMVNNDITFEGMLTIDHDVNFTSTKDVKFYAPRNYHFEVNNTNKAVVNIYFYRVTLEGRYNCDGGINCNVPVTIEGLKAQNTVAYHNYPTVQASGDLTLYDCKFIDNKQYNYSVRVQRPNTSGETKVLISDCEFTGNGASGAESGAIHVNDPYENSDNNKVTLTVENCIIKNNLGKNGTIFTSGNVNTLVSNCDIVDNTVYYSGGGIYAYSARSYNTLKIENSTISNNKASNGNGGGININKVPTKITSSEISNNTASSNGGGIGTNATDNYIYSNLTVGSDVVFSGNKASKGYYMTDSNDVTLHNNNIKATSFSAPFTEYAFNNYDIQYTKGTEIGNTYKANFFLEKTDTTPYATKNIVPGQPLVSLPAAPTRTGYVFLGWLNDETYAFIDASTVITKSTKIVAVWYKSA